MSPTARIAEWLKRHAGKQGVAGSIPGGGIKYHFEFFAYIPLMIARHTQMKSSMTFIQSNGWTEIDLILKQIWRRFIWWQVSFNSKMNVCLILVILRPEYENLSQTQDRDHDILILNEHVVCHSNL